MNQDKVVELTRSFTVRMHDLLDVLPQDFHGKVIGEQLRQVGSQLQANTEPVRNGNGLSNARLGAVERCAEECAHLINLAIAANLVRSQRAADLLQEARDLAATALSCRKARTRKPCPAA